MEKAPKVKIEKKEKNSFKDAKKYERNVQGQEKIAQSTKVYGKMCSLL